MSQRWVVAALAIVLGTSAVARGLQLEDDSELYRLALLAVTPGLSEKVPVALSETTMDLSHMWSEASDAPAQPYLHPRTRITYAKKDTVESFLNASAKRVRLPRGIAKMPGVLLVSDAEIRRAPLDHVGGFREKPLRGRASVSLSAIGFNENHTEALIWVDWYCGSLCGSGTIVFLVRDQGTWKVTKVDRYYMS